MAEGRVFRLKIDAYTPETMPMGRLAEYMADLAAILGERAAVHFVGLEASSTVLVHKVETEAVPKVQERVALAKRGDGPPDAVNGIRNLNRRLREDAGKAVLLEEAAEVLPFPGREAMIPTTFPAFNQNGALDGTVIRVGGRGATVPVHIDAGTRVYQCEATRELAKKLAVHLFTGEIRVSGQGRWHIDEGGNWILDRFSIRDFELLNDTPLTALVATLRGVTGSEWDTEPDPWGEINDMRREEDETD